MRHMLMRSLVTLLTMMPMSWSMPASTSKAHAELCKEWRYYQTKQDQGNVKRRRSADLPDRLDGRSRKKATSCRNDRPSSSCPSGLMQDYTVDWPLAVHEAHEARLCDQDEPVNILRQPLYYREQKRHFDLRDGPFVRAPVKNPNTDPQLLATQGKYVSPHGTIMNSAGWYLTAPQEDRRKIIQKMRRLWNFSEEPLGLLHADVQVIVSITPEFARFLLDPQAEQDLPLQMHIARLTFPRLTDLAEIEQAALIKEQLIGQFGLESEMADDLILMALKYEGMKDAPTEIAVQHIKNKLDDPRQFASDQFALHRRKFHL